MLSGSRLALLLALLAGLVNAAPARAQSAAPFVSIGCTVGVSSTQCLAASTWLSHAATIQNVSTGATVACAWGATPALNAAGSFLLLAGQAVTFGPATAGVPSAALNCIASAAATAVTIVGY